MANNQVAKKKNNELAVALNQSVLSVIGEEKLQGFERTFAMANAIQFLQDNLTPDVMKNIMRLQGSKLGFKTDKVYPLEVVKSCLIDASLVGVQSVGNHFNIIGGNMYVTKEGYGHLLGRVKGLKYMIKHEIPQIDSSKTFATVRSTITWTYNGEQREEKLEQQIKGNAYATADAYIGKAERKSRAWLFNQVSDIEVVDGEVEDVEYTVVEPVKAKPTKSKNTKVVTFKGFLKQLLTDSNINLDVEDTVDGFSDEDVEALIDLQSTLDKFTETKEVVDFASSSEFSDIAKEMIKKRLNIIKSK